MKIRFQCENDIFTPLLAKVKLSVADKGLALCGYQGNFNISEADSVYRQMEAVYTALQGEDLPEGRWDNSIAEIEEVFAGEELLLTPSLEAGGVLDIASYSCALLLEAELNPVLIFGENNIAVGVWLYDNYDMEECEIRNPEFAQEAYDEGGSMLAIDCGYLTQHRRFSDAVEAGCAIVKNFVFAEDIALGNSDLEESPVILKEGIPVYRFEDDGTCPYFNKLLHLYTDVSSDEDMAASIMSDEVQHKRWASCFMEGVGELNLEETKQEYPLAHLISLEQQIQETADRMSRSQLLLVQAGKGERESLAADTILQNLQIHKKTLVLSSGSSAICAAFADTGLTRFMLTQDQLLDVQHLKEMMDARNGEEPHVLHTRRMAVQQQRYQDASRAVKNYNRMLDEMTGCGKTLRELFTRWHSIQNCPVKIEITREQAQDVSALEMVKQYTQAVCHCQQVDEDGTIYLDFSRFTPQEITELTQLLRACEEPFDELIQLMTKLGTDIGREREENESAKSYMETMEKCVDMIHDCVELLDYHHYPEDIPTPTAQEIAQKEAYDYYIAKNEAISFLNSYWEIESLQLSDETVKNLILKCEIAQEELGQGILKNRACEVALQDIEAALSSAAKSDKIFKRLRKEQIHQICSNLQTYFQLPSSSTDAAIYSDMSELFQKNIKEDAVLFSSQMRLVRILKDFEEQQKSSDMFLENLRSCIQNCTGESDLDAVVHQWYELAEDVLGRLDAYSEAVKSVFRYLKISYREFAKKHPEDTMMKFIDDWEELLMEDKVYEEYQQAKMILLRNHLGSIQEQFSHMQETSAVLYAGFEKAWYQINLKLYQQNFDLQDYSMNLSSCEKLCSQLYANEIRQLENELLENVHRAYEEMDTELASEELSEIFKEAGYLLQEYYPVMFMTPNKALSLLRDTDIEYDQVIICDAEVIPYYQILYLSTKGHTLVMISEESEPPKHSVAWQAKHMGFPVLTSMEGGAGNE